ncbi:acyl-CoA thioesterase [Chryseobacterium sp. TY4]
MNLVFSKEVKITEEHLDKIRHVNNVQYVHWVEEIAAEHWDILKDKTNYSKDYWVLMDHHIQYKKQLFLDDILTIVTYPLSPIGIKQPRKVEFYCNDELVVLSETLWILFDSESHKIKRIDNNWLESLKTNI